MSNGSGEAKGASLWVSLHSVAHYPFMSPLLSWLQKITILFLFTFPLTYSQECVRKQVGISIALLSMPDHGKPMYNSVTLHP